MSYFKSYLLNIFEPLFGALSSLTLLSIQVIRYEDLALDPIKTAQNLYDFLHLDFPKEVKDWIYNNTQIRRYNVTACESLRYLKIF